MAMGTMKTVISFKFLYQRITERMYKEGRMAMWFARLLITKDVYTANKEYNMSSQSA